MNRQNIFDHAVNKVYESDLSFDEKMSRILGISKLEHVLGKLAKPLTTIPYLAALTSMTAGPLAVGLAEAQERKIQFTQPSKIVIVPDKDAKQEVKTQAPKNITSTKRYYSGDTLVTVEEFMKGDTLMTTETKELKPNTTFAKSDSFDYDAFKKTIPKDTLEKYKQDWLKRLPVLSLDRFVSLDDTININGEKYYIVAQVGSTHNPYNRRADVTTWLNDTYRQFLKVNGIDKNPERREKSMMVHFPKANKELFEYVFDKNGELMDVLYHGDSADVNGRVVNVNYPKNYKFANRNKHVLDLEHDLNYVWDKDLDNIVIDEMRLKQNLGERITGSKQRTITKMIKGAKQYVAGTLGKSYVSIGASSQGNDGPHTGLTNTELGILIPNKNWGVLARAEAGAGYNEGGNLEGFLRVSPGENLNLFLGGNTYVLPSDLDYLTDFSREKSVSGGLFANVPYLLLGVEGTNYTASSVNAATAASAAGHANIFAGLGNEENSPQMFGRLMLPFDDVKGREYGIGFSYGLKPKDVAERLMLEGKYKTSNLNFLTAATQGNHVYADLSIRNNDQVDAGLGTPGNAGGTFEKFDLGARIGRFYTTADLNHVPGNAYTVQDSVEIAPGFWIRLQPTTVEIRDIFSGKLNLGYNFTDNFGMGVELGEENLQDFKENFSVGLNANYRVNMGKSYKTQKTVPRK